MRSTNNNEGIFRSSGDHYITSKPSENVMYTNEFRYPTGVINPIDKRVTTKIVCIDSLFRNNYGSTNSSNFVWTLPEQIKNVVSMKIVALELPNQWYTVSSKLKTNQFRIKLYNMSKYADTSFNITIPDGNYMSSAFADTLQYYFQNTGNGLEYLYTDVDENTAKTIIRARQPSDGEDYPSPYDDSETNVDYSPNFYFVLEFDIFDDVNDNQKEQQKIQSLQKTLGWYMGFRQPTYTVTREDVYSDNTQSTPIVYTGYIASESTYGCNIHNYIFVDIDDFNKNMMTDTVISTTKDAYIGNNIIGRVTVSSLHNAIIFNNASDCIFREREYTGPVKLNKMHIRLLNKFGDVVDLNYNDFSLSLELKILY